MSVDIETAVSELNSAVGTLTSSTTEKVSLSRMDAVARQIADRFLEAVGNAELAAAFAVRNPGVLERAMHDAPDDMPIWKAIAYEAVNFIEEQLNGPAVILFIKQFDHDFDPVFEMKYFSLELVDEYEDVVIANNPERIPQFLSMAKRLRQELKKDELSSEVLDQIGQIASLPELSGKHQQDYRLYRDAYRARSGFEQRQVALAFR